jgi:hypothetical protein
VRSSLGYGVVGTQKEGPPLFAAPKVQRHWLAALAVVAWVSVCLQVYSNLSRNFAFVSLLGRLIDVFSYFTVSTNVLVALVATVGAQTGADGKPLASPGALTATAIYILVVGLTFAILLKGRVALYGWPAVVADFGIHEVTPVAFCAYWVLFVRKDKLNFRQPVVWLIYPAVYIAYTLARGAMIHKYPYFFADVDALGYPRALFNGGLFLLGFWLLGVGAVALGRIGWMSARP